MARRRANNGITVKNQDQVKTRAGFFTWNGIIKILPSEATRTEVVWVNGESGEGKACPREDAAGDK